MNRYRRLPSVLVLVAFLAAGAFYARSWGKIPSNSPGAGAQKLDELEKMISSGTAGAEDWVAYAQKLAAQKDFTLSALAYKEALKLHPYHRTAQFECAVTLAQAEDADALFDFMRDLTYAEPKMAVELFDRAELRRYLPEPRFAAMQKEAVGQSLD